MKAKKSKTKVTSVRKAREAVMRDIEEYWHCRLASLAELVVSQGKRIAELERVEAARQHQLSNARPFSDYWTIPGQGGPPRLPPLISKPLTDNPFYPPTGVVWCAIDKQHPPAAYPKPVPQPRPYYS